MRKAGNGLFDAFTKSSPYFRPGDKVRPWNLDSTTYTRRYR